MRRRYPNTFAMESKMDLPDSPLVLHDLSMTDDIRARFSALFGYGWQSLLAEAVGIHRVTMSRQWNGVQPLDPAIIAHLEWLESTPVSRWPARWSKLADLHKAKAKKDAAA